jgi:hypothetical protein
MRWEFDNGGNETNEESLNNIYTITPAVADYPEY